MAVTGCPQVGRGGQAARLNETAARREAAGGWYLGEVGRRARDRLETLAAHAIMHRRGEQATAVGVLRGVDHLLDRRQLDDLAGIHDPDAIGDLDRDPNIVGNEDHAEIELALPSAGSVQAGLYDVRGALVRTLASGPYAAGFHRIALDGTNSAGDAISPGVYFVKARTAGGEFRQRVVILH